MAKLHVFSDLAVCCLDQRVHAGWIFSTSVKIGIHKNGIICWSGTGGTSQTYNAYSLTLSLYYTFNSICIYSHGILEIQMIKLPFNLCS